MVSVKDVIKQIDWDICLKTAYAFFLLTYSGYSAWNGRFNLFLAIMPPLALGILWFQIIKIRRRLRENVPIIEDE